MTSRPFTQLNPTIPLQTEKGDGEAIAVIDYSSEHDLMWVVILDHDGTLWTIPNGKVRGFKNYSVGRNLDGQIPDRALFSALIAAHQSSPGETERQMRACLKPDDYRVLAKSLLERSGYAAFAAPSNVPV